MMAKIVVLVVTWSLALFTPGESLLCWVCIPKAAGEVESRDTAVKWTALITRKWPNVTQSDLGYCHDFDYGEKFQKVCDHGFRNTACIYAFNSHWVARTCGPLPKDVEGGQCQHLEHGVSVCYRLNDLSNLEGGGSALLPGMLPFLLLPILTTH